MVENLFQYIYLAGYIVIEVVRAPHRWRNSRDRVQGNIAQTRVPGLETVLMTISFAGLYFIPLSYIFSDWYSFADYHLPAALGWTGTGCGLFVMWILLQAHRDLGANWSPSLER